jgi:hypothetical protein
MEVYKVAKLMKYTKTTCIFAAFLNIKQNYNIS